MAEPMFYVRLDGRGRELNVVPAVASWDRLGSPGQVRSAAFIEGVRQALAEEAPIAPPVALGLNVGLPDTVPLDALNDLDNYLFPLVPKLTEQTKWNFVSVWATKRHQSTSSICIGTAVPTEDPGGTYAFEVITTASTSTSEYKHQIVDQISSASPLAGDGIQLQLAFVVGPRRAWPNLWKPTIDSLGAILGRDDGAHEWNARDGRITSLGLHCVVDPHVGNNVTIAIRASAIRGEP